MNRTSTPRKGFALVAAITAIVVIGALITGIFFASTQEYRIGSNTLLQARALTAAEYGLNVVLAQQGTVAPDSGWNPAWNNALGTGQIVTRQYLPKDGSVDTLRVTRLDAKSFFVVSEGRAGVAGNSRAQARRRVGALIRLVMPQINFLGALTARGQARIGGSSFINGVDEPPPGWGCGPAGPALPGLAVSDNDSLTTSSCGGLSCVEGNPKVLETPAAADTSTYFQFGETDWAQLVSAATKIVPPSTLTGLGPRLNADGTCDAGHATNWGDPIKDVIPGACENFYPIIYATGDLSISGGVGQGILLVEGDLQVQGGAEFYGPVIVKGRLQTTGTGGHFNGGVMAANVDFEQNTVLGNAVIQFSRCAIEKAINGSAQPSPARGRSWVELY
ncbi:MAG TPA: hypothetical protein VJ596_07250 [Gemmatimonadaceae bacterium]|nr:hypothetical protein [Gemmatimonadaceae bacterium]